MAVLTPWVSLDSWDPLLRTVANGHFFRYICIYTLQCGDLHRFPLGPAKKTLALKTTLVVVFSVRISRLQNFRKDL